MEIELEIKDHIIKIENADSVASSKPQAASYGYSCKFCGTKFSIFVDVKESECPSCGKVISTRRVRNRGNLNVPANVSTKNTYYCILCSKTFSEQHIFKNHVRSHINNKKQNNLSKERLFLEENSNESNTKDGILPLQIKAQDYACSVCGKLFSLENDLKTHLNMHSNQTTIQYGNKRKLSDFNNISAENDTIIENNEKNTNNARQSNYSQFCGAEIEKEKLKNFNNVNSCIKKTFSNIKTKTNKRNTENCSKSTKSKSGETKDEPPYNCNECFKTFQKKLLLKAHMKNMHSHIKKSKRFFECDHCLKIMSYRHTLIRHIQRSHLGHRYTCPICLKSMLPDSRQNHMKLHSGERPMKCNYCDKGFIEKSKLKFHILALHLHKSGPQSTSAEKTSRIKNYQCEYCGMCSDYPLTRHLKTHTGEKSFNCDICGKHFASKPGLKSHIINHRDLRPHQCTYCNKSFNSKTNLNRHIRYHEGIKLHKCQYCEKTFFERGTLNVHLKRHFSTDSTFSCNVCGKEFVRKSDLSEHEISHLIEKPYKCPECNKSFSRKSTMNKHFLTHFSTTIYKSFKCDICSKSFRRKGHLQAHIMRHTGKKNYSCSICNKRFFLVVGLNEHMRGHTGERPFKCSLCDHPGFINSSNMKAHLKSKHKMIFKCEYCKNLFPNKTCIFEHIINIHSCKIAE